MRIIQCVNLRCVLLTSVTFNVLLIYLDLMIKTDLVLFAKKSESMEPGTLNSDEQHDSVIPQTKLTNMSDTQSQQGVGETSLPVIEKMGTEEESVLCNHCVSTTSDHSSPSHHLLVVMIVSAPANFKQRNSVRRTWKNGYKNRTYYVKFVIGTKNLSVDIITALERENSENQDLLLMPELMDGYRNLPHKVLVGMTWFDTNINYSYLLKCDDDSFILLDTIEDELRQRKSSTGLYWGSMQPRSWPQSEGKWRETNWKNCNTYFPFATGGGYILSSDVIHRVVLNADALIVYNNEDVSVASWIVSFMLERKHDTRLCYHGCYPRCIATVIHDSEQSLEDKHEYYLNTGRVC